VFTGTRLEGFEATGSRKAFDWSYDAYKNWPADDVIHEPAVFSTVESARVAKAKELVTGGVLKRVGETERGGRPLTAYAGRPMVDPSARVAPGEEGYTREILLDEQTGLIVRELVRNASGELVYDAQRDYETVPADQFEDLMTLSIPSSYRPYTDVDIGPDSYYLPDHAFSSAEVKAELADLVNWLPFPLYYLGDELADSMGHQLVLRLVRSIESSENWGSIAWTPEDIGGLGDAPVVAPLMLEMEYFSKDYPKDAVGLSLTERDPSLFRSNSSLSFPLPHWVKWKDVQINGYIDTAYRFAGGRVCLAQRGPTQIELVTSDPGELVIEAGRAIKPVRVTGG
jgi:hypothetical protein